MQRLLLVLAVVALLVEVYGLVSCALMPSDRVRTLPKWLWLCVVVLVPVVGAVAWIVIGRERATRTAPAAVRAPDDDPGRFGPAGSWRSREALAEQDQRIARLEAELAALDAEGDADGDPRRPRG